MLRNCACMLLLTASALGCRSPYHSDQLAAFGGLTGAGLGAIIGSHSGNAGAGAALGAGVGAITGAAVGGAIDESEARNRALIAAQLGRPAPTGAVGTHDVMQLTAAGVADEVIITHIQNNGTTGPPTKDDLIHLQTAGVSPAVIRAMQTAQLPPPPAGPPVIVEEHIYPSPPCAYHYRPYPRFHYHHHHGRHHRRRGRVGWAVSVGN